MVNRSGLTRRSPSPAPQRTKKAKRFTRKDLSCTYKRRFIKGKRCVENPATRRKRVNGYKNMHKFQPK